MESSTSSASGGNKKRVTYFYSSKMGEYCYGEDEYMVPHRICMAHNLIVNYKLNRHINICSPYLAERADLERFHLPDYVDFLSSVSPEVVRDPSQAYRLKSYNVGTGDCPIFPGVFEFSQLSVGGSLGAAVNLNLKQADIAINWAGGLHHAKKNAASGFCYMNDIVIAILELLKVYRRVLYVDIDIHHGDAVEEAFFLTNRVMTVSFHRFGKVKDAKGRLHSFFPGTGAVDVIGEDEGKYYALNVPLKAGIDDESFHQFLFIPIMDKVKEVYDPEVVVIQCGADSLAGDRLGDFNLSLKGHADCLRHLKTFNIPLLVLGGGGYTVENVARCWTLETAVAAGVELDDQLPVNDFYKCFGPSYSLNVEASTEVPNMNSRKDLTDMSNNLLERLHQYTHAPNVPFQTTPPIFEPPEQNEEHIDHRQKKYK